MRQNPLTKHHEVIEKIAKESGISYLAVFGSYARGEQTENSDIDLLVEFSKPVGLLHLINTEHKLEDALGIKVDLITKNGLSKHIRPYIKSDIKTVYETT